MNGLIFLSLNIQKAQSIGSFFMEVTIIWVGTRDSTYKNHFLRGLHWIRSTQTAVTESKAQISLLCWHTVLESIPSEDFFFERRKNAWKLANYKHRNCKIRYSLKIQGETCNLLFLLNTNPLFLKKKGKRKI